MKTKKRKSKTPKKRKAKAPASRQKRATAVLYDEALPKFADLVTEHLGSGGLKRGLFLRDAEGNITYVVRGRITRAERDVLVKAITKAIPAYASNLPVATPDELFDDQLDKPDVGTLENIGTTIRPRFVRLVERRIVGQDWISGIWDPIQNVPPIVVFASHKGGVGRSTALAIAAAHFARRGRSILAIDVDLEAPGLGELCVQEDKQPLFGALDYFVENGHGTVDHRFLDQMRVPSTLVGGRGRAFVVPAVGRRCREYPENVIGKISRAYLEDVSNDGKRTTLLEQMRTMISDLASRNKYDAIFVDARAGLNETTAATIQGLGADILLFGVDTPQTWDGYRFFLAHLARFKPASGSDDWRFRLKMIHAKAIANKTSFARFRDNAFELFAEGFYDEGEDKEMGQEGSFAFDLDDRSAPHYGWPIYMDEAYYEFDPVSHPEQLDPKRYERAFGEFLRLLGDRLGLK